MDRQIGGYTETGRQVERRATEKKKPDRWVETGGDEPDGHTEEVGTGGWTDKWTDKRLDLNGTNRRTDGRTGNRRTERKPRQRLAMGGQTDQQADGRMRPILSD